MAVHNTLGKEGEQLAADYFIDRGYDILYRNWRYSRFEIDIIAIKKDTLHFIEVKLLTSKKGFPEESVSKKKIKNLMTAAEEFLYQNDQYKNFQFDILAINHPQSGTTEYFLIEDIYYYN